MEPIVHKKPLVVIDFDETLVEQDSCTQIGQVVCPGSEDIGMITWPPVTVNNFDREKKQDVDWAMRKMTFVPGMERLIRALGQEEFDLIILSGSCVYLIESFLKRKCQSFLISVE